MKHCLLSSLLIIAAGLAGFAPTPAHSQAPLDNALFTSATSAEDTLGNDWAFLLFQLTADVETLLSRRLAVYQKPGNPEDPGSYQKSGHIALQLDPKVIKVYLNRAAALGETPGDLNIAIDQLFGELVPDVSLPVEQKLSAVIRGSLEDPSQLGNLMLLARMHPGVSLALGLAHTQRIPGGRTTFEVRELDAADRELGVVGRVTVEAGAPVLLPAPDAPVAVPETSPMGHLNARLRWGVSNDLRRLALLQYGYNLYRVDKDFTESEGWQNTPPQAGLLAELAVGTPAVKRVNRAPVLPTAIFNTIEALDLNADPSTFFIADDNGLALPEAVPFEDGDRFYYFVAARDILGRDGVTSPGTEVVILDRVPPHAPRRPDVTNETRFIDGEELFHLKITWRQNDHPGESISGYFVYRWDHPQDVQRFGANSSYNLISGLIPHVPGQTHQSYIDDGAGAPTAAEGDLDKTYWYTVRAVKLSVASNISANSAPAFGVLRNRFAPEAPAGQIFINCPRPDVTPDRVEDLASTSADDPSEMLLDLIAIRAQERIAWAEFGIGGDRGAPLEVLGRYHFVFQRPHVRTRLNLPRFPTEDEILRVFCRVGDASGKVSEWVWLEERDALPAGQVRRYFFDAFSVDEEVLLDENAKANGCIAHTPGGLTFPGGLGSAPGGDGENPQAPIKLQFDLTERSEEFRIYRRIDNGDLTLWRQGLADEAEANTVVQEDSSFPPNAGEISYFGQLLDDNGNGSELKLLGHVSLAQPAPQPMLAAPEVDGLEADPRMKIRWFSPPHGVERFAIILAVDPGPVPVSISPELSNNTAAGEGMVPKMPKLNLDFDPDNEPNTKIVGIYETPSLDSGFGPGPEYELSIPVQPGKTYSVQIRAIAKAGGIYRYSIPYDFVWPTQDPEDMDGPEVPWPARSLPAASPIFHSLIHPIRVNQPGDFNGLGVVVGLIPPDALNGSGELLSPNGNYTAALARDENDAAGTLQPFMLYRYQMPSDAFPLTSEDLIQVTPLIRNIASRAGAGVRELRDPFFRVLPPDPTTAGPDDPWTLVLLDTQPAVRTARYAYILVRFHDDGEIASVHPIPAITAQ